MAGSSPAMTMGGMTNADTGRRRAVEHFRFRYGGSIPAGSAACCARLLLIVLLFGCLLTACTPPPKTDTPKEKFPLIYYDPGTY